MGWWSSIKKAVKKVWRVVKAVVRAVVKIVVEIISRVINSIAQILFFWKEKKMRIVVLILRDEKGNPLIDEDITNRDQIQVILRNDLNDAIDYAKKIFKKRMNIAIKPYGTLIQTLEGSAPTAALGINCDSTARGIGISIAGALILGGIGILGGPVTVGVGIAVGFGIGAAISGKTSGGALYNEFSEAGDYFAKNTAGWGWLRMNLYFPITIFIVRDITEKKGCSLGPLTDYVTVSIKGVARESTMAHELGHCCGLLHRKDQPDNLMRPDVPRGDNITGWQKFIVRTSRHCTFW